MLNVGAVLDITGLIPNVKQETTVCHICRMRGDFFMTEVFYSPREKIAPVQKIAVVRANFSRPNNGRGIFSQTVIVNKSPGRVFLYSACMKKSLPFARGNFLTGAKISRDTGNDVCFRKKQNQDKHNYRHATRCDKK